MKDRIVYMTAIPKDILSRLIANLEILNERPRPQCRDCADCFGVCTSSGLDCDMQELIEKAKSYVQGPT